MKKETTKNRIGIALLIFISIFSIPFIVWNITFGFIAGYFLLTVFAGGGYYYMKRKRMRIIFLSLLTGFIGYLAFLPLTLSKLNEQQKVYYAKLKKTKELNKLEMWNLYGLHLTTAFAGLPVAPEAALEVILMHFPDKDKKRVFKSGFFLESKKLREAMAKSNKGHFNWKSKDFYLSSPEYRVSLALNPVDYEVKRFDDRLEYTVKVPVHWYYGIVKILDKSPFVIEVNESLFRYIEEKEWIHMYWAVWKHTENL